MARLWLWAILSVAVGTAGVGWYVVPPLKPRGYAGVEFAAMTPAAAARAPLLKTRGALIYRVDEEGPAAKAGLHMGEVVAAIDGTPISSADQAAGIVRAHAAGDTARFTVFDEPRGDIHPKTLALVFSVFPEKPRKRSVEPPRTLAREYFNLPAMAANAAWSLKLARGPTIRPLAMPGLGAGRCNGFAPEHWYVAGHAPDDSMIHVAAPQGFEHAIFAGASLDGRDPEEFVLSFIEQNFEDKVTPASMQSLPFGFSLIKFGLPRGAAGFAEYRVTRDAKGGGRIAVWVVAVASADVSWAVPQTGAVAFSLHCQTVDEPQPSPHDPALAPTAISVDCLKDKCREGDFAAQYLNVLKLGYAHGPDGAVWLIKPKTDFWQNGAEGPGYYHQTGGLNEKLEPGRTN
ncbi:MAG TPA: PDZ domain-containing protein [Rhizomicrobium sp.]|nr:PDZ domain-containing protein [Rhizomicrobium sp.]